MNLTDHQQRAFDAIVRFLASSESFFILKGYAGVGKTFMLYHLLNEVSVFDIVFTSPTNKATKVLRRTLGAHGANTKTIYSLLGIKMVHDEDRMVLEMPKKMLDISMYRVIIIDEASMVNRQMFDYMELVAKAFPEVKIIYVGDPAQLPPVGERISPVWKAKYRSAMLTRVMRNDSELLALATHIREQLKLYPKSNIILESNHTDRQGVWKYRNNRGFYNALNVAIEKELFTTPETKLIGWRNRTIEEYNRYIRRRRFADADKYQYVVGDNVMIAAPVQRGSKILAHIDDEGTITASDIVNHSIYKDMDVYRTSVKTDDGKTLELDIVHEDSADKLKLRLHDLAVEAKRDKTKWGAFWALKNSFDSVRYGQAISAHRAQGSTMTNIFLDSTDILANQDGREAIRCLYVGASRPTATLLIK